LCDSSRRQIEQGGIVRDQADADFIRFIFEPADFHKLFWRSRNFPASPAKVESKFVFHSRRRGNLNNSGIANSGMMRYGGVK